MQLKTRNVVVRSINLQRSEMKASFVTNLTTVAQILLRCVVGNLNLKQPGSNKLPQLLPSEGQKMSSQTSVCTSALCS